MMELYYVTYGSEGQPFVGGWTEIEAPDFESACALFSAVHPSKDGFLNCSSVYSKEYFENSRMYQNGNLGARCHERIVVTRTAESGRASA